jgi:hypothetical protein
MQWWGNELPSRVTGNQEIEPAGKKKAGQQVRPLKTELRTKLQRQQQ